MHFLNRLPPELFALLAALLGALISRPLNPDEQNALGNFILSIGQTMATSSAQGQNLQAMSEKDDMLKKICEMSEQLEDMKRRLRGK